MKITTRIISGYGLFIAVLITLVIYQVIIINRMQSIIRNLSSISFQDGLACLQALRDRDLVEEFTIKSFATRADPDYLLKLQESQKGFESRLRQIRTFAKSAEEQAEVNKLSQVWKTFIADKERMLQTLTNGGSPLLPESLQNDLDQLRAQTFSVYEAGVRSMSSMVEKSRKTGETAALVLYCATIAALAISILISYLIFRSISKPLAHLTEGTRAIAEGKFFYRLDAARNDEFSQLARDFNTMTLRLNELDELKKDFVSHVSHELKTPLASMQETIQLMLEQIPGPLTDKQKRLLELNLQSGMRLTSMIRNILDLARTEAGVMEYELKSRDLVPLVRNAIEELDMQAQERQIRIKTSFPSDPLTVECDGDRIVQVMVNLVGNAVKFSPRKASVEIDIEAVRDIPQGMPEHWRRRVSMNAELGRYYGLVTVSDSGPGIPDADKERVFEKFHQVKQEKKIAGQGVGLGLAICRTIAQAHRGAIWAEDNPGGGGSRFRLLLRSGGNREEPVQRSSQPI
jgi:signal transduction histidine kinase